jgi:hypothetical protein
MAEGILGARVRLHDGRVGELVLIKYAGSSNGQAAKLSREVLV